MEISPQAGNALRAVERRGRRVARTPFFRHLTRWGFFTKALVHGMVGALALAAALGRGGRTTDTRGALAALASEPSGATLLALLAIGLGGLAVWFTVDGIADPRRTKRAGAGALQRVGQVLLGLLHGGLAVAAARMVAGERPGPASDTLVKSWTARLLTLPGGWLLGLLAGAVVVALAAKQIRTGITRSFRASLHLRAMPPWLRRLASAVGVAGFVTQGAVLAMVGGWLMRAAFDENAREARGLDGALAALARQADGAVLLAVCAAGMLAYAAYALVEGAYGRR